jgi:hypothetical protein
MKKSREQLIDEIVENFNWDKVYKTMEALSWKWVDSEGETPSIGRLITTATRLLRDAYDGAEKEQETYLSGTGGFEAVCYMDGDDMYRLELRFVVASWDVDIEND